MARGAVPARLTAPSLDSHRERTPTMLTTDDRDAPAARRAIHDVVDRMELTFSREVFVPAIQVAREDGTSCEDIRDVLRKDWKPAMTRAR
jgi:hypothetical protein